MDGIRFYLFLGRLSQAPILGVLMKKAVSLYYRYIHTNSIILPLKDIEEIIADASDITVDPCPCRLTADHDPCSAPLFVCMRINRSARVSIGQQGRGLEKTEALKIARNARRHGLVFSLESCLQPYQNNICMCCSCCCIAMRMRYEFGIDMYHCGPYLPVCDEPGCTACGTCIEVCPVKAVSGGTARPVTDIDRCLGCGICAERCPSQCITMAEQPGRVREVSEPGFFRLVVSVAYVYLFMAPALMAYRLVTGSSMDLSRRALPRKSDVVLTGKQVQPSPPVQQDMP